MAARGKRLPIEHGADAANAQRCRRLHGVMCGLCGPVHAEHHRQRRADSAAARERGRQLKLAKVRAWTRLACAHPEEFRGLLADELRRAASSGAGSAPCPTARSGAAAGPGSRR